MANDQGQNHYVTADVTARSVMFIRLPIFLEVPYKNFKEKRKWETEMFTSNRFDDVLDVSIVKQFHV